MSGYVGDVILRGVEDIQKQPLTAAQVLQTYSQVPLNYAQADQARAAAAEAQSKVPYYGELTTKQQIENEQNRLILDRGIKPGFEPQPDNSGVTVPQPVDPALTPPPAQPYQPPAPQQSSQAPTPPPARTPAGVWVPPLSPAGKGSDTAMYRPPGSVQLAANTQPGVMSDVGPGLYTTTSTPAPSGDVPPPQPTGSHALMAQATPPPAVAPPPQPAGSGALVAQAAPPPTPGTGAAALQARGGPNYNPSGVAPGSVYMPGVGPVPAAVNRDFWIGVAHGQDPTTLKANIAAQRYRRLTEEASGASSPQDWDARVTNMYREGLLDNQSASQLLGHYEMKDYYVDKLTTAAEQASNAIARTNQGLRLTPSGTQVAPEAAAGAESVTRGRTAGEGQSQLWTVPDPDHPGQTLTYRVPLSQTEQFQQEQLRLGRKPTPGAIVGPQSSNDQGGPNAAPNAVQQNFASTYMPMAQRVSAQTGIPAETILAQAAMESDFGRHMPQNNFFGLGVYGGNRPTYPTAEAGFQAFADAYNKRYKGSTTTDQGPQAYGDSLAVAGYNPNTPARGGVTYGQRVANFQRSMGLRTQYAGPGVPPEGSPASAIATGMVGAGANADTLEAGRPGGGATAGPQVAQSRYGVPTTPVWNPDQKEAADRDRPLIEEDSKTVGGLGNDQLALDQSISSMHDVLARLDTAITGPGADWRKKVSASLAQFGPSWVQDFAKKLTDGNIDPSQASNSEVVMKQLFLSSQQAEAQLLRHGGLGSSQLYAAMFPNPNMMPKSIAEMTNFLSMMQQRTRDWNQGATEHFNQNYAVRPGATDATGAPLRYPPISTFTAKFNASGSANAPQVYGASVGILDKQPIDVWTKGLDKDQQWAALQTVKRANPGYKFDKTNVPKIFWPKEWGD